MVCSQKYLQKKKISSNIIHNYSKITILSIFQRVSNFIDEYLKFVKKYSEYFQFQRYFL